MLVVMPVSIDELGDKDRLSSPKTRGREEALEPGVLPGVRPAPPGGRICPARRPPRSRSALEPLKDVPLGLAPPGRGRARLALLSGHYIYYHYGCDGVDDPGSGRVYRTLQTLCSWPEGRPAGVPERAAVQAALGDMGDKPPGLRGSRGWIGCVEASLCLDHFGGPPRAPMSRAPWSRASGGTGEALFPLGRGRGACNVITDSLLRTGTEQLPGRRGWARHFRGGPSAARELVVSMATSGARARRAWSRHRRRAGPARIPGAQPPALRRDPGPGPSSACAPARGYARLPPAAAAPA
eukprot:bmy_21766T0